MTYCALAARGLFVPALLLAAGSAQAQARIRALTDTIAGHHVGGVTIDLVGNIYVADFGDVVWKITPEGKRQVFASGLYGASGNAIDAEGNLLQANAYANSITRIDRKGQATPFVSSGLHSPIGMAIDRHTGDIYVANCGDNTIARVAKGRTVSSFAKSDLLRCPNGMAFDREGNLYVANYRDNRMVKVDSKGVVTSFAAVSEKGLGHLCFKDDRFYVIAHEAHAIYEVRLDGTATRILGNGERGVVDGAGAKARLSSSLPRRTIIREIDLEPANATGSAQPRSPRQ